MSEPTEQQPTPLQRPRTAQSRRSRAKKQAEEVTSALASTPSATRQDSTNASQPVPSQPASTELPTGICWGEFPPLERQVELKQRLHEWQQENNHSDRLGPFAAQQLTGADVCWLAAWVAGNENVQIGWQGLVSRTVSTKRLSRLNLQGAILHEAQLQGALLLLAQLEQANLAGAQLQRADFQQAQLEKANLSDAQLQGASFYLAQLEGALLSNAQLQGADLSSARLQGAHLSGAQLQGASLWMAQLQEAYLGDANLQGAKLEGAQLQGADMRFAYLDVMTVLDKAILDIHTRMCGVVWNGAPFRYIGWHHLPMLGDETFARQPLSDGGKRKTKEDWSGYYEDAVQAYRQLASALRGQGLNEVADRFTYRAQVMQRKAIWWQLRSRKFSKLGAYLFSLFLAVLTGYGFRLRRIILAYVLVVLSFAAAYWGLGFLAPPGLNLLQAIIVSVTAFHGRVFSNPYTLTEPQIIFTALEAIFGLVIEGLFVAMLVQRFFNR